MDRNVLAINIGNSRLAVGELIAGKLESVTRLSHAQRGDWPVILEQSWLRLSKQGPTAVVVASVNPPLDELLEQTVLDTTGQRALWVGTDLDVPIQVLTDVPAETGVDRILGVAAAYKQLGRACMVVDAGTAITVNLCNDEGAFLGGAIAPGASMLLHALHEHTAQLPHVALNIPQGPYGRNTQQAILGGVYYGIRGLVRELASNYAKALGAWPLIIATGGDAMNLFEGWELIHSISPNLTLCGIALAYAAHSHGDGNL
jgi:type III pantothenate kinase